MHISITPGTVQVAVSCAFTKNISMDDSEDILERTLYLNCDAQIRATFKDARAIRHTHYSIALTPKGFKQIDDAIRKTEQEDSCKIIRKQIVIDQESFTETKKENLND